MSHLVVLVFDDPYKADEARAAVRRMGGEGLLEIDETALIIKGADGKTQVRQDQDTPAKSQHLGHVAGLITAALTGTTPFILAGTVVGRLIGRLTDHSATDRFLREAKK